MMAERLGLVEAFAIVIWLVIPPALMLHIVCAGDRGLWLESEAMRDGEG